MARSKSSGNWLQEHVNDPYVKQAQKDGYRSRASYKLIQLNEKDKLIRPGMLIVDLGSAPGGWSQVAANLVGAKGKVIATDILPMDPLKNVDFILGDFTEQAVVDQILARLENRKPDLIICDIAPNISGIDVCRPGLFHVSGRTRTRYGPTGAQTQGRFRGQGISRRRLGRLFEGAAPLVRESC